VIGSNRRSISISIRSRSIDPNPSQMHRSIDPVPLDPEPLDPDPLDPDPLDPDPLDPDPSQIHRFIHPSPLHLDP
jgi:hypothetical protein